MTDDLDRRCLMSVLRQFITPQVVRTERAPLTSSGAYCVPPDGSIESYREHIRALPRWVVCDRPVGYSDGLGRRASTQRPDRHIM